MPVEQFRYLKVSPRGFANEVVYLKVPLSKLQEAEKEFENLEDESDGGYSCWTDDKQAKIPGVAVDWSDRHHVLQ